MRYYKIINDGYLIAVGTGSGGIEISSVEYTSLRQHFGTKPDAKNGYDYRLKSDLTWERYELPPIFEDEEASSEDYEYALGRFGV